MVRAKFKVLKNEPQPTATLADTCARIVLSPDYRGPGNETWSKYTPSGSVILMVTNPEAIEVFEVGKEFFLDFTPAT